MTTTITFNNVSKQFPVRGAPREQPQARFTALQDVSLAIDPGDFLVLVGPSGCGKSTLLDLLAGLTAPSRGSVRMNGRPVHGPGPDRGVVFQQYALLPWRTVQGNVEFGLEAQEVSRRERRIRAREHLDLVGLGGFAGHYPHELSGGMKQRVAIARSLAVDPDVLLMDEPFAAVDAQTRETLQDELLRIWERTGKTIVFITHAIDEAVYLGRRVAVLSPRPGRVRTVIDVALPSRRMADDLRSTTDFGRYRHQVWIALSAQDSGEDGASEHAGSPGAPVPSAAEHQPGSEVGSVGQHV